LKNLGDYRPEKLSRSAYWAGVVLIWTSLIAFLLLVPRQSHAAYADIQLQGTVPAVQKYPFRSSIRIEVSGRLGIDPTLNNALVLTGLDGNGISLGQYSSVDPGARAQIDSIIKSQEVVNVSGLVHVYCTLYEMAHDQHGCREFDTSRSIDIHYFAMPPVAAAVAPVAAGMPETTVKDGSATISQPAAYTPAMPVFAPTDSVQVRVDACNQASFGMTFDRHRQDFIAQCVFGH
jgi:hypothetical protein